MKRVKGKSSLEGYSLKNMETIEGREGQGLLATLLKDGVEIATFADYGDGSEVDIRILDTLDKFKFAIDMERMMKICKPQNSATVEWMNNSLQCAVETLVEVLAELEYIVIHAKIIENKTQGGFYALFIEDSSYLYGGDCTADLGLDCTGTKSKDISEERFIQKAVKPKIEDIQKNGHKILGIAVLKGKFDWQLTFEDYKELFNPTL